MRSMTDGWGVPVRPTHPSIAQSTGLSVGEKPKEILSSSQEVYGRKQSFDLTQLLAKGVLGRHELFLHLMKSRQSSERG